MPKHDKIPRPQIGTFHRHELAVLGTPCGKIEQLASALVQALPELKTVYADADHQAGDNDRTAAMQAGSWGIFSDKISFTRLDFTGQLTDFQKKVLLLDADWVLVNGNHFEAAAQIAVIDPAKPLEKKLHKLTNVQLLLKSSDAVAIPDYLSAHLEGRSVPVLAWQDTAAIAQWVKGYLASRRAPLYGLVLTGGKSERMGQDKAQLNYHGKPQQQHTADLLAQHCERVFISCRFEQMAAVPVGYEGLPDTFTDLGPLSGILSAFRQYPDAAWLVLACDLPLMQAATLAQLVNERNPLKMATTFQSPHDNFPEPLVTIWEPKAYPILLQFLSMGYQCPRKALINNDIKLLQPVFPEHLANANTPEEAAAVLQALHKQTEQIT
ncbi:NTP transferase domain-containing protein [Rhodoflexus caldus]|uniref:NTP transferase domain-containing protein n=1 Tax=Rhodoflexus caldus TaxID=2891236 RepID=UPI00202A7364|nr:NTP transferase domain-containing protein [Rhodoflexus caldus]